MGGHLPCILLPFQLFVVAPAFLLKENIQDLADFDLRVFIVFALVATCTSLLLLSIDLLLERAGAAPHFSRLIEYLCFFVILTGFALPVSVSSGMKDPSRVAVNGVNLAAALLLALLMLLLSSSRYHRALYLATILFVAFNTATTLPALYSLLDAGRSAGKSIFEVSSEKNIFVLSFDGVPGSAVREVLEESPELEREFGGFIFYDRVASSAPATSASTAASLYGNRNFKEGSETEEDLWASAPHWLLTNNLNSSGYDVSTHNIYNNQFVERTRRHGHLAARPPPSALMLLNYSLARTLTRFAVLRSQAAERLERRLERALSPLSEEDLMLLEQVSSSRSPKWKRKVVTPTVLDFYEYVRRIEVATATPTAHFLHFTYSHYPVEFDRDCRFRGHDGEWFRARQNFQGVMEEVFCILTQASQFIEKLKALGVFERALVVLKSDHGKPVQYGKPGSIEALPIRGNPMWGYGRYRPFLALKGFGAGQEGVGHDQHPVMLDDLARTVCLHADVEMNCNAYTGYDLLGDDFAGISSAEVTLFVVGSGRGDYRYDNHEAITVRREADVLESLFAALSCADSDGECEESRR